MRVRRKGQIRNDRAEMKLLDLAGHEADGHLLTALGLTATDLVSKGLLKQKAPGDYITVPVEDADGQQGFRRLKVIFNSTSTSAVDDVSGERFDLAEGDLCRYDISKGYLRERLDELLRPQLVDMPLTVDEEEPYVLGNYRMGDQRIPVALVSRLWEPKHADKLDTKLRQSNLGLTIVLSTTAGQPRRYLGPGIVVSLDTLAKDVSGKVSIDLAPVDQQFGAVHVPQPRRCHDAGKACCAASRPDHLQWPVHRGQSDRGVRGGENQVPAH